MRKIAILILAIFVISSLAGCFEKEEKNNSREKIEWLTYQEGMKEANESGKVVFLYMCNPTSEICKSVESKVFASDAVVEKSKDFVMIKVNVNDNKNENLIYKYRLQYIPFLPTIIFIYNGEILHRLIAYDVYNPDTKEAISSLIENMNKGLEKKIWGRDFSFETLDGKTKHLKDYRGKVTIVDLMATWCNPCRMQMGELEKVLNHYGDEINIISIDVEKQDDADKIKSTFGDHIDEWDFGMDRYGIAQKYLLQGSIPTLAIFDKYGRLQYLRSGLVQSQNLIGIIDEIME